MTALNHADAVYLGADAADAVYLGEELIWSAVPPSPTYADVVLADNPVAFYRLADTGSAMADATGKAAGTLSGSYARQQASLLPSGEGASTAFSGGSAMGPTTTLVNQPSGVWSWEAWVLLPALPAARQTLLGFTGQRYAGDLSINPNGTVWIGRDAQAVDQRIASTIQLAAGRAYHVVGTHGPLRLYVNGADVSGTAGAAIAAVPAALRPQIAAANGYNALQGRVQEAAFYEQALSVDQVRAHYRAALAPDPYQRVVLADRPVAYWPLDDFAGSTAADLAGDNDGTYWGGVLLNQPGPTPSPAAAFDGTGAMYGARQLPDLQPPFSMGLWFKSSQAAGTLLAFAGQQTAAPAAAVSAVLYLMSNGRAIGGVLSSTGARNASYTPANVNLADGNWHYLVGTVAGGTFALYLDGAHVVNTAVGTPGMTAQAGWWRLAGWTGALNGWASATGGFFGGSLAHAAIFDYALTSQQVAAHYAARA